MYFLKQFSTIFKVNFVTPKTIFAVSHDRCLFTVKVAGDDLVILYWPLETYNHFSKITFVQYYIHRHKSKIMWLKFSSNRLVKQGIEPMTPGLQGEWLIHYTTVYPSSSY